MKYVGIIIALFCLCLPIAAQQHEPQAEHKLVQFQLALVKRGPKSMAAGWETSSLREQHLAYVQSLAQAGKLMIAGRIKDDPELLGVVIFRTDSAAQARNWLNADPAITGGQFTAELHPWWSEDVMKKTATPGNFAFHRAPSLLENFTG